MHPNVNAISSAVVGAVPVRSVSTLTALAVLVAAVAAVVGAVTHPALGDAAVVGALELGGRAELICKKRGD